MEGTRGSKAELNRSERKREAVIDGRVGGTAVELRKRVSPH